MDTRTYRELAEGLIAASLEAGRAIMAHYRTGVAVETKADDSPVTAADRAAEKILLTRLNAIAPAIPVVSEEAVSSCGAPKAVARQFFLVDPLDGTKEFIHGRDEFTVNVALIEDGVPSFGIVYAPACARVYLTIGADHAVAADLPVTAVPCPLHEMSLRELRTRIAPASGVTVAVSRSHMDAKTEKFLKRFTVEGTTSAGSSLKFGLVAAAEADVYPRLGRTMEWDTAAGHAVLKAAGGAVLTEKGTPFVYGKTDAGFANPGFVAWGRAPDK